MMFGKYKWLSIIAIVVFSLFMILNSSCSLEGEVFTITFDINSGNGMAPQMYAAIDGSSITLPDGDGLSRDGYVFSGWNTDRFGSGSNYNAGASYTVNKNITLYARWRNPALTLELGDIGPGRGRVIYRNDEGFLMTDTGELCNYLEATLLGVNYRWARDSSGHSVSGISRVIGTGRRNTYLLLDAMADYAVAAQVCNDYSGGEKNDWFLPSLDELNLIYVNRSYLGSVETGWYWSSTTDINNYPRIRTQNFRNGEQSSHYYQDALSIIALRAF